MEVCSDNHVSPPSESDISDVLLDEQHDEQLVNSANDTITLHSRQIDEYEDELTLLGNRLTNAEDLLKYIAATYVSPKKKKIVDTCSNNYMNNKGKLNWYTNCFFFVCDSLIYFN